jgi:hypothetical protein
MSDRRGLFIVAAHFLAMWPLFYGGHCQDISASSLGGILAILGQILFIWAVVHPHDKPDKK